MARLTRQEAAWSMTEAANEPYLNLVQRYVFAPYFAGTIAATQAQGFAKASTVDGAVGSKAVGQPKKQLTVHLGIAR